MGKTSSPRTSVSQELNSHRKKAFTVRPIVTTSSPVSGPRKEWSIVYRACIGLVASKRMTIVSAPVADHRDTAPAAAVEGLHEERIAELVGDGVEVELAVVPGGGVGVFGVVERVLVGHQHRLRHLEPQPDHGAVGGVLLHRLERVR